MQALNYVFQLCIELTKMIRPYSWGAHFKVFFSVLILNCWKSFYFSTNLKVIVYRTILVWGEAFTGLSWSMEFGVWNPTHLSKICFNLSSDDPIWKCGIYIWIQDQELPVILACILPTRAGMVWYCCLTKKQRKGHKKVAKKPSTTNRKYIQVNIAHCPWPAACTLHFDFMHFHRTQEPLQLHFTSRWNTYLTWGSKVQIWSSLPPSSFHIWGCRQASWTLKLLSISLPKRR